MRVHGLSPSSRRAWIEIGRHRWQVVGQLGVALLAEGVDRNFCHAYHKGDPGRVALLAEGVDRNDSVLVAHRPDAGRPPRGGRG